MVTPLSVAEVQLPVENLARILSFLPKIRTLSLADLLVPFNAQSKVPSEYKRRRLQRLSLNNFQVETLPIELYPKLPNPLPNFFDLFITVDEVKIFACQFDTQFLYQKFAFPSQLSIKSLAFVGGGAAQFFQCLNPLDTAKCFVLLSAACENIQDVVALGELVQLSQYTLRTFKVYVRGYFPSGCDRDVESIWARLSLANCTGLRHTLHMEATLWCYDPIADNLKENNRSSWNNIIKIAVHAPTSVQSVFLSLYLYTPRRKLQQKIVLRRDVPVVL